MKTRWLAFAFLIGCGGSGLSPGTHADAGTTPDAFVACSAHTDRTSCTADPACEAASCCPGDSIVGCYPKGQGPVLECFAGCPQAAGCDSHTTQADCDADATCASVTYEDPAADCANNQSCAAFVQCIDRSAPCTLGPPSTQGCAKTVGCDQSQAFYSVDGCPVGCVDRTKCSAS